MRKKILVTGTSGFIGSRFAREFQTEFEIVSVSLRKINPEELDFTDVHSVLHLAAIVHQSKKIPESVYFDVNTNLTERLAKAAKSSGVKHFVFFSSVAVFGSHGWLNERNFGLSIQSPCFPADAYGASKLAAEKLLVKLVDLNFVVCIIRPPVVYGDGAKGNLRSLSNLIRIFPLLPFAYKDNRRSVVSIDNLLAQTAFVLRTQFAGVIIPQDSKTISLQEIVEILARQQGRRIIMLRPPNFLVSMLKLVAPKLCLKLFGSLVFRQGEDVRSSEYSFTNIVD